MSKFSEKDQKSIVEVKEHLQKIMPEDIHPDDKVRVMCDYHVHRFLETRDGDAEHTARALLAWVRWRRYCDAKDPVKVPGGGKSFGSIHTTKSKGSYTDTTDTWVGIDAIPKDEEVELEYQHGMGFLHGYGLKDEPVVYWRPRVHNPRDYDKRRLAKYVLWCAARVEEHLGLEGDQGVLVVVDLNGFGMRNFDYEQLMELLVLMKRSFPGLLSRCLIVDSPTVFWACWSVISPMLPHYLASRVEFISSAQLPNFIAPEHIPTAFGGTSGFVHPAENAPDGGFGFAYLVNGKTDSNPALNQNLTEDEAKELALKQQAEAEAKKSSGGIASWFGW